MSVHLSMSHGGNGVATSGATSGAKRRPSCPGSLQDGAVTPKAAEPPVAEARLSISLEWLDADCERAVDERCALADSSARARAAVSARWSRIDMPPPNAMRQKRRILTLRGSANEFIIYHFCAQANSARTSRGRTECFGRHPSNRCFSLRQRRTRPRQRE